MEGSVMVTEIVSILTSGISTVATNIGQGLSTLATNLFLTGSGEAQTLSTFGVVTIVFAGVSLAIGLCRSVVRMISTLGGHNV